MTPRALHPCDAAGRMAKLGRNRSGRHGGVPENALSRPSTIYFRSLLHSLLCIAALVLGFRLSRESLFVLLSLSASEGSIFSSKLVVHDTVPPEGNDIALRFPYIKETGEPSLPHPRKASTHVPATKSSRVHVGRHEILVRSWPHPYPDQTAMAHHLLKLVQQEQRRMDGLHRGRQLLVVTPTYARTFQGLHLTSLIHTLRIIPYPLIWVVIEAGGVTNETSWLLSSSHIPYHHLGVEQPMPSDWEQRRRIEAHMRADGLRFIREHRLDGIVVFADDSNTFTMDFFDEVQKVKWMGAFSVGLLSFDRPESSFSESLELKQDLHSVTLKEHSPSFPLQGPACNSSQHIVGWYASKDVKNMAGNAGLEWAGFALNSKLLWDEDTAKPTGFKSWSNLFDGRRSFVVTPADLLKDMAVLEPLGDCGRKVLLWWLRAEARADSKFPSRWVIDPSLEIVVPSRKTPWPDPPKIFPPPPSFSAFSHNSKDLGTHRGARASRGKRKPRDVEKPRSVQLASQDLGNGSRREV